VYDPKGARCEEYNRMNTFLEKRKTFYLQEQGRKKRLFEECYIAVLKEDKQKRKTVRRKTKSKRLFKKRDRQLMNQILIGRDGKGVIDHGCVNSGDCLSEHEAQYSCPCCLLKSWQPCTLFE